MKITLIKPAQTGKNLRRQTSTMEPLGLEYLAAWIKKSGFNAEILDLHILKREIKDLGNGVFRVGMKRNDVMQVLIDKKPDVIGISCLFREYAFDVIDLVNLCREILPKSFIVLGGQDVAVRPEFYFKFSRPDLIVYGEGELTFEDILTHLKNGKSLEEIPGTIKFKSDNVIKNSPRERIKNLDELPFPKRDLPLYLDRDIQKITFPFAKKLPAAIIQSSRGCKMKCAFCDIVCIWDRWTCRTPKHVVDEMGYLNREFGVREFSFIDDNFMLDTQRVKDICTEIIKRELKITFEINPGVSVWTIDKEVIDLMVRAGLYRICLPIESGSHQTLKFIGKPVDLVKAKDMIRYCNNLGLFTYGNILIGFPFENRREIEESIKWAYRSDLDMVHFLIVEPYDGARMFPIYLDNNWIEMNDRQNSGIRMYRTKHFTFKELNRIRNNAQLKYFFIRIFDYLNPFQFKSRVWPKINSFLRLRYFLKISFLVITGSAIPENFALFKLLKRRKQVLYNYR